MFSFVHKISDTFGLVGVPPCKGGSKSRNTALLAAAVLCAVLPFESDHLATLLAGAAAYLFYSMLQAHAPRRLKKRGDKQFCSADRSPVGGAAHEQKRTPRGRERRAERTARTTVTQPEVPVLGAKTEVRTPSARPVTAPTFRVAGWEAEVEELAAQITPTPECEKIVAQIARIVKRAIWPMFPDAEVVSFASANLQAGRAFGVAVPDVDIVANMSPKTLTRHLQSRSIRNRTASASNAEDLEMRHLQKNAIRACTEKLVSSSGLKFRRSSFRGAEPKVTLLAPASLGLSDVNVPVDFSVNSLAPLHNAALLTECGKIDPRAKALALLVRRWAKDRGVCHAAKGHLSPHVWTLLVIYFLQVGADGDGAVLPPLECFEFSSGLIMKRSEAKPGWAREPSQRARPETHLAKLFRDFFRFYSSFDWRGEAVAVRTGERAALAMSLPVHVILSEEGADTEVGPSIEDPFATDQNLGSCLSAWSFARLKEEFSRAHGLCAAGASLTELLEPWAPLAEDDGER